MTFDGAPIDKAMRAIERFLQASEQPSFVLTNDHLLALSRSIAAAEGARESLLPAAETDQRYAELLQRLRLRLAELTSDLTQQRAELLAARDRLTRTQDWHQLVFGLQ